jgi:hypothetical protein
MKAFLRLISPLTGLAVCAASLLLSPAPAVADVVYDFNYVFSGTAPANPAPWIEATFQNVGANQVSLTIANIGLASGEYDIGVYFNLDPSLDPLNLSFSAPVKTGTFDDPSINLAINGYKADGDGDYDINLGFANADAGRFDVGESITYQLSISGSSPLSASSFFFLSTSGGGEGTYYAAAHLAGGSTSAWIAPIPEPASGALVLLSLGLWSGRRWLRRSAARV